MLQTLLLSPFLFFFSFFFLKRLKSPLLGFLDRIEWKKFKKMFFKKKLFLEGFGSKERFEKVIDYLDNYPFYPPKIGKIEWDENKTRFGRTKSKKKTPYVSLVGKFLSPTSEMLQNGEKEVVFNLAFPYDFEEEKNFKRSTKMVVSLPALGQQGFGWRFKNIGEQMIDEGCIFISPVPAIYTFRQAEGQDSFGITWMSGVDCPAGLISFPEEIRALINHFSVLNPDLDEKNEKECLREIPHEIKTKENDYKVITRFPFNIKNVVCAGMSMGTMIVSHLVKLKVFNDDLLSANKKKVLFSTVCYLSCGCQPNFMVEQGANKDLTLNTSKNNLPFDWNLAKNAYNYDLHGSIDFLMNEMTDPHTFKLSSSKTDLFYAVSLNASHDYLLRKQERESMDRILKSCLSRSAYNNKLDSSFVDGGHFWPFIATEIGFKSPMIFYNKKIKEIFQKMEDFYLKNNN